MRRAILATLVGLAACVERSADEPMTGSGSGGGSGSGSGSDSGIESSSDAGTGGIACAPLLDGCAPFDAEGVGDCAQVLGWAWDGADCVPVEGCACEGEQCCHLQDDYDACVSAIGECYELALCLRCPEGTQCFQRCEGAGYCNVPTCEPCDGCPCACADMYEACMNGGGGDGYVGVDLVCQGFGRPFVVEGERRQARVVASEGWSAIDRVPQVRALASDARDRLAVAWRDAAVAEHASIASFARLVLDLLAHGAPAVLVRAAAAAMQDEVEHARVSFALASVYGGAPAAPGPLAVEGASASADLAELAASTVVEGCVGETIAAIEAAVAARACVDPVVRDVLRRIAEDELRHAELAWAIVRWAIDRGGAGVRDRVAAAFRRAAVVHDVGDAVGDASLSRHGVLDPSTRARLQAAAVRDAILPCARILLGRE